MDVRWGKPDDAGELVRLRALMWHSMGVDREDDWHDVAERQLRAGLAEGTFFAAVVDPPDASPGLAACGVGMVWQGLAGPGDGRFGYVQSMCTDACWRGRGFARAVLDALVGRFAEDGVRVVRLHASRFGEPLYRAVGFGDSGYPELQLRLG